MLSSEINPLLTIAPPKLPLPTNARVPPLLTVVVPEYVFAAESVSVPEPVLVSPPKPEIRPLLAPVETNTV